MEHIGARVTTPPPSAADSWECKHAINENGEAMGNIFLGLGTMAATGETGAGLVVGAGITFLAMGDMIVKGDAADHACHTGKYADPGPPADRIVRQR